MPLPTERGQFSGDRLSVEQLVLVLESRLETVYCKIRCLPQRLLVTMACYDTDCGFSFTASFLPWLVSTSVWTSHDHALRYWMRPPFDRFLQKLFSLPMVS